MSSELSTGQRLRRERARLNWSQERLAEALGVTTHSINRWERDKVLPHPYYREQLCRIFDKKPEELFGSPEKEPESLPVWMVPHRRNLYFTGREDAIRYLRDTFATRKTGVSSQTCAISGLGGIGKTQVAVEYAYRYADEYRAILWARADSYQSLTTDFATFAHADLLNLPEQADTDQAQVVEAVKRWLRQHQGWLLILDNADDIEMVDDFIPVRSEGYVLLSTRSQLTGPGMESFELEKMGPEEGALLLLRRAKIIAEDALLISARDADRANAEGICRMLDGLPLALDQAAAYIEEKQSGLEAYQKLYQTHREALLKQRGAFSKREYPHSVATTWSLSFSQLDQAENASAADLLRLCAFLYPDGIPESLIIAGVGNSIANLQQFARDPLLLDHAIRTLRRYSLLRRNPETRQITMHRLVQTVLKDVMDKETHRAWAERAVCVMSEAFPRVEFATWPTCQAYLPHALLCADLIEQWDMQLLEAAQLLDRTAHYLLDHARYTQAETLCRRALSIRESMQGAEHLDTARTVHLLAIVCAAQSKYDAAEPLFQRALALYEQVAESEPYDAEVAKVLSGLAILYDDQGKYELSRPLHLRALALYEAQSNPDAIEMSECLSNLALHYFDLAEYDLAEPLYLRALAIQEHAPNPNHPGYAHTLHNLAALYFRRGKYEQAERYFLQALAIREQALGPFHPRVAATINNLAVVYERQNNLSKAEHFYLRALAIREQTLSPTHTDVANSLHNVATCYLLQGKYEQAEAHYLRSLAIHEQSFGPDHPYVAQNLNGLGRLYGAQGQYDRAASLFERALAIQEQTLGPEHLDIAITLERYAGVLKKMERVEQAASLEQRAQSIRAKHA
jgi:tetratricopeptide (TPR) repeat protein/transcriptional regulator with XRE-family HTH domain